MGREGESCHRTRAQPESEKRTCTDRAPKVFNLTRRKGRLETGRTKRRSKDRNNDEVTTKRRYDVTRERVLPDYTWKVN